MGIAGRIAELAGDQLLELLGEHVLEHLGLLVHAIPRHAQALHQVQLEQAVVAHDLKRYPAAGLGQLNAVVALMDDQTELAQPLDHARRRGRCYAETLGERIGADRQISNRLGVVLDGRGPQRVGFLVHCHF